jgi:hypothetical protein
MLGDAKLLMRLLQPPEQRRPLHRRMFSGPYPTIISAAWKHTARKSEPIKVRSISWGSRFRLWMHRALPRDLSF